MKTRLLPFALALVVLSGLIPGRCSGSTCSAWMWACLLGVKEPLAWRMEADAGLVIDLPASLQDEAARPCRQAYAFRTEVVPPARSVRLLGWWPFEEIGGTGAADASPNHRDASCQGQVAMGGDGRVGKSFWFNGTDASVSIPAASGFNTRAQSVVFWMNLDADRTNPMALLSRSPTNTPWAVQIDRGSGTQRWLKYLVQGQASARMQVPAGQWAYVAIVQDKNAIRMHLDGRIAPNVLGALPALPPGIEPICIGTRGQRDFFKGSLDEVAIFEGALTPEEVNRIYRQGLRAFGELTLHRRRRQETEKDSGDTFRAHFSAPIKGGSFSLSVPLPAAFGRVEGFNAFAALQDPGAHAIKLDRLTVSRP